VRLGVGWLGTGVSADLVRQAGPSGSIPRSATDTLEVLHQMLSIIQRQQLTPILVFDDTDRWLGGYGPADGDDLARSFFSRVLPALAELECSVVVAVHHRYLADDRIRSAIAQSLEIRTELPLLRDASAVAAVLGSRIEAHSPGSPLAEVRDAMTDGAVSVLFDLYRHGRRGEIRTLLRTAHTALTDACDSGADRITRELVLAANQAWDSR
jgi:hypothetical protein